LAAVDELAGATAAGLAAGAEGDDAGAAGDAAAAGLAAAGGALGFAVDGALVGLAVVGPEQASINAASETVSPAPNLDEKTDRWDMSSPEGWYETLNRAICRSSSDALPLVNE